MRSIALFLLVASVLTIAACQTAPVRKPVDGHATTPASAGSALLRGRATYLERLQLPRGATLEVQLIADDSAATIAMQRFDDLRGPPFEFALSYDQARIPAGTRCSLRATLRDASGQLQFFTRNRVEVTPGSDALVDFRLVRVAIR